jgi:hypothetical protein
VVVEVAGDEAGGRHDVVVEEEQHVPRRGRRARVAGSRGAAARAVDDAQRQPEVREGRRAHDRLGRVVDDDHLAAGRQPVAR